MVSDSGAPKRLKDFGIDHRLIQVEETQAMRDIAAKIAALQSELDGLREAQQRRTWAAYLRQIRDNARTRVFRF